MATHEEEENLYEILGVARTANAADIQAAFKKKARELHPDVNKAPDAEENFKRLNAAYAILKDEGKRSRYDAFGIRGAKRRRPPTPPPSRPGPRPSPRRPSNGVRFEDINVDSEEFKNPFDFLNRSAAKRKKKDEPEVNLSIPIVHAYTGTDLTVSVDLPGPNGPETKKLRIKIPKGAKAGDRLKLKDPNIVVVLSFEQDPRFTIDGRDITMELAITPWEAALGDTIDFAAPGGTLKLKIPEGTSTGRRLRLRGQGLPLKPGREGQPGDLYVVLKLVIPPNTSDAERELWTKLRAAAHFNPR
jgi:curved DNA-binding protein